MTAELLHMAGLDGHETFGERVECRAAKRRVSGGLFLVLAFGVRPGGMLQHPSGLISDVGTLARRHSPRD